MSKQAQFLPHDDITDVYTTSVIEESEEELTAADKAANAAIEQLSSNAEKGKVIRIYRQLGSGQESMEFVSKYPADKYSIDDLIEKMQAEYGGGDYRFMVYNEKGKLSANKLISIAVKNKSSFEGDGMASVFSQYMNKQDKLLESLLTKNDSGNDRASMLREMLIMKQLFSNDNVQVQNTDPMAQMKNMLEMMTMLKEAANPEKEESENGFGSIIKESIPLLTAIAQGVNNGAQNQPQKRTHQNQPQTKGKDQMLTTVAKKLYEEACKSTPSDIVANNIASQIPDIYIDKFKSFLLDEKIIEKMINEKYELKDFKPWLIDVVEWCKWIVGEKSKFDGVEENQDNENTDNLNSKNVQNNKSIDGDSKR